LGKEFGSGVAGRSSIRQEESIMNARITISALIMSLTLAGPALAAKESTGLLDQYANKESTGLLDQYANKESTGLLDQYANKESTGLLDQYANKESTGLLDQYANKESTGLLDQYASKDSSGPQRGAWWKQTTQVG
jgi:hypothetical protein